MNFFLTGRHFIFTTTINNVNMFSAQTFCSTSSIHCYVTSTNDGSLFTAVNRSCNIGELVSFHKVYTSQELICRIYTVKVFAVDIHKVRQASTGTNINCIKAFFFHQFFNGKGTTDYSINNNLNAQIFQRFNFVLYDFFRQTELRNTIHQNATCNVESFVNGYVITKFSQVASSSKTGRATAYDCYFFTFSNDFGSFYLVQAMFTCVIRYKTFQTTDSNGFTLDTQHAFTFALVFLGANATTNCGQAVFTFQNLNRFSKVFFRNSFDEFRNLYIYGATFYATRFRTVEATLRFVNCHFFSVAKSYFFKIFIADISRLFRHGISHSSTHLQ